MEARDCEEEAVEEALFARAMQGGLPDRQGMGEACSRGAGS